MLQRWVGLIGSVVLACLLPACVPDVAPTSVSVHLACSGISGDNASSVGDSKATVGLMSTLTPGNPVFDFPNATFTARVPVEATGAYPVSFDLDWGAPAAGDSTTRIFHDLFELTTLTVVAEDWTVFADGAGAVLEAAGPTTAVDTSEPLKLSPMHLDGQVAPVRSGTVRYRPDAIRLTVPVNASVAGITFNTLRLTCGVAAGGSVPTWPTTQVV